MVAFLLTLNFIHCHFFWDLPGASLSALDFGRTGRMPSLCVTPPLFLRSLPSPHASPPSHSHQV